MFEIYKYHIDNLAGSNMIALPEGATILSVGNQQGNLVLWASINTEIKTTEVRTIKCVLTGQPTNLYFCKFIGTVLFDNASFVVHVFEEVM